ncbi:hypothetical protein Dvar_72110 [Desulfosarcina variabilis str. Montpellier]
MNEEPPILQKVSSRMRLMGWLSIIFGALAIAMPWIAGQSILLMVGALVIAAGIMRMIWAFQAGSLGKGVLVFLIGVLTLLAGVTVIASPLVSSAILTIILSIYFFVDGLSELFAAFSLQDGKGWLLFDAVVTILLSIMIFTGFPLAGTVAIGVFLGIKLIFVGVTMLSIRSLIHKGV